MSVVCLQIEPTTRCNFTCGFCCGRSMSQSDLDVTLFQRALDDYPSIRHLELQGEGEPLMHPRFFDMVDIANAHGVLVSFITNGSYFTPDHVARLLDCGGVAKISVSLESADSATFRAIRGGKLEKVVEGVERLMAARGKRGLATPVVALSVTLLQRTAGHVPAILDLYRRLRLDGGITAQPLQQMPTYKAAYTSAMENESLSAHEVDDRMLSFFRATRHVQRERRRTEGFYDVLMAGWRPASRRCPWLDRGLYVNRDGLITPCCMVKDEAHALGRIGVDPPERILGRRDALRATLERGEIPAPCGGCEIARYATMGRLELVGRAVRSSLRVLQQPEPHHGCAKIEST